MTKKYNLTSYLKFITLILFFCSNFIFGQSPELSQFYTHYNKSIDLNKLSLFSESINELKLAIDYAKSNDLDEKYIEASVFMGEMMRRTADHKKGLEILEKLTDSKKYLKLHVRKLGRIAALYAESKYKLTNSPNDSLKKYLKIALKIAKDNNFEAEEASLCNELGFFKLHNESLLSAKPYLLRSANLFRKLKDDNNYVVVMCHVLFINLKQKEFKKADNIINELLSLVKNHNWYGTEQTLYRNIAHRYLTVGDSLNSYKWRFKEIDAAGKLLASRNNNEMSYYRVKYDTEKFKNEAKSIKIEAEEQKKINYILLIFLCVFIIFVLIIAYLFVKKNKLSKSLEISNKKFQMLMLESNHRIKNNLQMILSMVDYSNEQANENESKALSKISGKIQTVSVLHKHLYADLHNEFVYINVYFDEIVRLYTKMVPNKIEIITDITAIQIKSERIVYFGLILNELLANTVEHNISEIKKVIINIKPHLNGYLFEYCDHSTHNNTINKGAGSILLDQLIKRVKGSNFKLDKKTGYYKFNFKDAI